MKRKCLQIICILMILLLLTGCSQQGEVFDVYGATTAPVTAVPQVQITPQSQSVMEENPYDDIDWTEAALTEEEADQAEAEQYSSSSSSSDVGYATAYPYAGATPILLDPIDLPTPTPKPELSFTYVEYSSSRLGVTFQGPAGWVMDESQSQLCTLTEPSNQMKDGQLCIITISAEPINSNYKQSELKSHVKQRLDSLYTSDFASFSTSLTATRNMMGSKGVYANYSGTLNSGVKVGGRILYVSVNNTLYGLEIVYPYGFKSSFETVFGKVRSSMSLIK